MTDPLENLGPGKIFYLQGFDNVNYFKMYDNLIDLASDTPSRTWTLTTGSDGTGGVVYDGVFYYNGSSTGNMIKYDLTLMAQTGSVLLPDAGFRNTYNYTWGGFSDIDFAVDESGLWVLYATPGNGGKLVVSKLNTADLSIVQTWNTNSEIKTDMGNAFVICGVVYCIDSYSDASTTINYKFDTNTSTDTSISIPFINSPGDYNSMVDYNPNEKVLYSWDNGRLQKYSITLE
jgi:hypothetical protein